VNDVLEVLRKGLAPHYTVEREIGVGGMARVYLAHERQPARQVAIKVMNPEVATPAFRQRFIREVEVTSRLSHPNIVPILAADDCLFVPDGPDGLCYYVMPYVEGESLRDRLLRDKTLPLERALHITFQVADGLSYAHAHGVIHRDVKPENILLSGNGAVIADFGIARAISAAGAPVLTDVGQPVGSPAYMSPEQLAGSRALDPRTDVYSLACVFYEMLVGEAPLLDLTHGQGMRPVAVEIRLRGQSVSARTARLIRDAIFRGLAPEAGDRFDSVDDFVASLRDAVGRPSGRRTWIPRLSGRLSRVLVTAGIFLAGAAVTWLATRGRVLDPRRIAVTGFEDLSGDPTLAPLGHIAADWVTQVLVANGTVEVVPALGTGHLDAAAVAKLAKRTGAGTVVSGSYYRTGDSVRFQLRIIDASRGTVRRVLEPVGARAQAPLEAATVIRQRITAVVDTLFPR
jgi:serine/threonine-protein kinase